jgi:hypothetical protein
MPNQMAREVIAEYAFMGPGVELERTLPLHHDEGSIIACRVVTKYPGHGLRAYRPGFLRLSTERLCIVRRYGFRRDRIIEIPRAAITKLNVDKAPLHIHFQGPRCEEEIQILRAATVGKDDGRGTVKQTTADVLAFRRGGNPASLKGAGLALAAWTSAP